MISVEEISSIILEYAEHRWIPKFVLLPEESIRLIGNRLREEHPELAIRRSDGTGVWFSRRSQPDREAWELRRLSGAPFALVVVIDNDVSFEEREEVLRETERRMFDGTHPEPTSH